MKNKKKLNKNVMVIEKMDFDLVDNVFDALHLAFHPEGFDDPDYELDSRCFALWTLFLTSVGWTDEEYWAEYNSRPHEHSCPECGEALTASGEHISDEADGEPIDSGKVLPESKPN